MTNPVLLPQLPKRAADSHKGDYGRALLIGGSRGMAGAIALAGMACLRSGAGLVKLAVPDCCLNVVATFEPSYMTTPLACDEDGRIGIAAKNTIGKLAEDATCIACGPGVGRSLALTQLVAWLYRTVQKPIVFDADSLFALAEVPEELSRQAAGPRILTPHPGEFSRLSGTSASHRDEQIHAAKEMAARHGVIILLKGQRTFITDGTREAYNTTGNPGMATGGCGDVLTGVITALVCQKLSPFDAAVLGAHVHGLAGDLAAAELGQVSMIASDLIRFLPQAFQQVMS